MAKLKAGLMTTQRFAVSAFQFLQKRFEELHLISIDPRLAEKNKVAGYYDYSELCKKNSVELYQLQNYGLKNEEDVAYINSLELDILCVLGWNRIIPPEVLSGVRLGTIGSHSSPGILPFGRGRAPVVWTIRLGFSHIYSHLFKMDEGVDTGEILAVRQIPIGPEDDVRLVYKKIAYTQVDLLPSALDNLINGKTYQGPAGAMDLLLPKRSQDDAFFDWDAPAADIANLVRAVSPSYHPAFFQCKDETRSVSKVRVWDLPVRADAQPGEVVSILDQAVLVKCGLGSLLLEEHDIDLEAIEPGDKLI